jgi:hypothetical protein
MQAVLEPILQVGVEAAHLGVAEVFIYSTNQFYESLNCRL